MRGLWRELVVRSVKGAMPRTESRRSSERSADAPEEGFRIVGVRGKGATPELLWTIENYNVVKFDNVYYALPHGLPVDWESGTVSTLPGVLVGKTVKEVTDELDRVLDGRLKAAAEVEALPAASKGSGPGGEYSKVPILIGSVDGYNIVSYEGWVYGIPQSLGHVDLTETDIMEMAGVIRDVSKDVVENEILSAVHADHAAA
jgi:hypothetical protein